MRPANGAPLASDETCLGTAFTKTLFPGDTNTMVEAILASQDIAEQRSPVPASIRAQDFFNYYGVDLTAQNASAAPGTPYVAVEGVKRTAPGRYDVAVAIQAPPITNAERKPLDLTLVVDLTPTMWGLGLDHAHAAIKSIAGSLQKGDRVHLVTTAPTPVLDLEITGPNDPALLAFDASLAIDNAGTLLEALELGYSSARASAQDSTWNRVVVLSAGDGAEETVPAEMIGQAAHDQKIFLVAAATGSTYGKFQRFLSKASRAGRGPFVHVGANGAAEELFGARFNELMGYSFDDLQVHLALPGHARLLEDGPSVPSVTTTPVEQYIGPGGSQLFLFRLQTCAAPPSTDVVGVEVTFKDATGLDGSVQKSFSFPTANSTEEHPVYDKTAAIVAYVDALRAMDTKRMQYARDAVANAKLSNASTLDLADLDAIDLLLTLHPVVSTPQ
jgi:Ca-activated chloride channel homolog